MERYFHVKFGRPSLLCVFHINVHVYVYFAFMKYVNVTSLERPLQYTQFLWYTCTFLLKVKKQSLTFSRSLEIRNVPLYVSNI